MRAAKGEELRRSAEDEKLRNHRQSVQRDQAEALRRILSADSRDHRAILNLRGHTGALTTAAVTKAFRQQSLLVHPDKNSASDAEEGFKKLQAAYALLKEQARTGGGDTYVPAPAAPAYPAPSGRAGGTGGSGGSSSYKTSFGTGFHGGYSADGYGAGGNSSSSCGGAGSGGASGGTARDGAGDGGASGGAACGTGFAPGSSSCSQGSSTSRHGQTHSSQQPPWSARSDQAARDEYRYWQTFVAEEAAASQRASGGPPRRSSSHKTWI
jgi:hypothetical protein